MDNQQRRMEERLMWLGGILDGEGCVTAMAGHTKTGHGFAYKHRRYVPLIGLVNTDYKIIVMATAILKEANVPYWMNEKARTSAVRPTWKPKWEVMITGMKRCRKAIEILRPYIFGEKAVKMDAMKLWIDRRLSTEQKKEYDGEDYRLLNLFRNSPITLRDYTPRPTLKVGEDRVQSSAKVEALV